MANREHAKADVLQGTLDLMVLQTLDTLGALHGYAIAARLEQVSSGALQLNTRPGRSDAARERARGPETGSLATIKGTVLTFASPAPKKGNVYPELKLEKGLDVSVSLLAPLTVRIPRAK